MTTHEEEYAQPPDDNVDETVKVDHSEWQDTYNALADGVNSFILVGGLTF